MRLDKDAHDQGHYAYHDDGRMICHVLTKSHNPAFEQHRPGAPNPPPRFVDRAKEDAEIHFTGSKVTVADLKALVAALES